MQPLPYCRAIGIKPRTLEVWDDMGLARDMIDAGIWIDGMRSIVDGHPPADILLELSDLPYAELGLPQYDTERLLARHLDRFGIAVERGATLTALSQDAEIVAVGLEHADGGGSERATFRYVLGCDATRARHCLRLSRKLDCVIRAVGQSARHMRGPLGPGVVTRSPRGIQRRLWAGESMSISVHNPDQYMGSLRQIIAQGRKRLGLLVGAGAPASIRMAGGASLIPATDGLTDAVLAALTAKYGATIDAIKAEIHNPNIENVLSRVRSLAGVIGKTKVHELDGVGHVGLGEAICEEIGKVVNRALPDDSTPYSEIVTWVSGTDRDHAVEIFTTNYDLLFEQALERGKAPYFDGFTGASEPFFDPSSVASDDLPPRWTRVVEAAWFTRLEKQRTQRSDEPESRKRRTSCSPSTSNTTKRKKRPMRRCSIGSAPFL